MADSTTSWSGDRRGFPAAIRKQIMDRDHWSCQINGTGCKRKATQADHIKPHAEGGDDSAANGQAVCATCHWIKTMAEQARGRTRVSKWRKPMSHPGLI